MLQTCPGHARDVPRLYLFFRGGVLGCRVRTPDVRRLFLCVLQAKADRNMLDEKSRAQWSEYVVNCYLQGVRCGSDRARMLLSRVLWIIDTQVSKAPPDSRNTSKSENLLKIREIPHLDPNPPKSSKSLNP